MLYSNLSNEELLEDFFRQMLKYDTCSPVLFREIESRGLVFACNKGNLEDALNCIEIIGCSKTDE